MFLGSPELGPPGVPSSQGRLDASRDDEKEKLRANYAKGAAKGSGCFWRLVGLT